MKIDSDPKNIEYERHFHIAYHDNWAPESVPKGFLKLGENFENSKEVINFEKVLTYYQGNCFKISVFSKEIDNSISKIRAFQLNSNQSINMMTVYITSKVNSDGVIFNSWKDGGSMKVTFEETDHFKLVDMKSKERKYSKTKLTCRLVI